MGLDFLNLAKAFLPANSPWMQKIQMAQNMAQHFQPTKEGIADLMRQNGKTVDDLRTAVNALNNPAVAGILNKFMPGMTNNLQQAGQSLIHDMEAPVPPAYPPTLPIPQTPTATNVSTMTSSAPFASTSQTSDLASSLQARLAALK